MKSRLLVLAVLATAPAGARAAGVTDVVSSFGPDGRFHAAVEANVVHESESATITKEYQQGADQPGGAQVIDAKELHYNSQRTVLDLLARIGLYQGLELRIGLPVVLNWADSWHLASGTTPETSVIATNDFSNTDPTRATCPAPERFQDNVPEGGWVVNGNTCTPQARTAAAGAVPLPVAPVFPTQGSAHFSGIGDPTLGLRWAALDQDRDRGSPTWVLGFTWSIPAADIRDPTALNTEADPGGAGSGFQRFTFYTALSRRSRVAEPYARVFFTLSEPGGKAFDVCHSSTKASLGTPENCGTQEWAGKTNAQPSQVGGFSFGSEFDATRRGAPMRFYGDLGADIEYHSQGRDYNEATFMVNRLTYSEEFMSLGAHAGLGFSPVKNVSLLVEGRGGLETAHLLTNERIGTPTTGPGCPTGDTVDLNNACNSLNPNFDYRWDLPGRRLRATQIFNWAALAQLILSF